MIGCDTCTHAKRLRHQQAPRRIFKYMGLIQIFANESKKAARAKAAIKRPDLRLPSQSEIALDF
jgi:hypothetical protein